MSPPPRISVVVPVWDEVRRLPALLDALDICRPAPLEVVVADGGSDDGTREIARIRARLVDAPRGRAAQQNAGAAAVTGDVLWFLHADCLPSPGAVGEIADAVAGGAPGGCFRVAFPPEELRRHPLLPWIERGIDLRTRATRSGTGDQGLFVRRGVFEALGGFPEWPLFEDVRMARGLHRAGRPAVCRGPLLTSARRWLVHGPARTMARMWALRLGYLAGVPPERLARAWRQTPAP
ncbi:MAG TPA: TIGR04283 family arsenosugar biosynthesis glycosyltransferase [Gemmatimonadota bacterium]|nr:TIGR04283 family arsenosugar biosynthesis glycosyltransferase [Gemmatimonadota bacterium]